MRNAFLVAALLIAFSWLPVNAQQGSTIAVGEKDKCPVCGMFVAKYPDFVARIDYADGSYAVFDGVKDMFKYLLDLPKYNGDKKKSDISAIQVTDYYTMAGIDGRTAFFAQGSDVYGPMGRELIPFATKADALEFQKDHGAQKILRFEQIDTSIIATLD